MSVMALHSIPFCEISFANISFRLIIFSFSSTMSSDILAAAGVVVIFSVVSDFC
jgi:hypothetical protein